MKTLIFILALAFIEGINLRRGDKKHNTTRTKCKTRQDPYDCFSGNGEDYVGLVMNTESGRSCSNWIKQGKYKATTKGIGNHNYCRNPKGSKDKPWCFVKDPSKDWEYCTVAECKEQAAAPEPWKAPKGSKSDDEPCVYEPPDVPAVTEFAEGQACMDHRGDKVWLIGNKKYDAADAEACAGECR